MNEDQDTQPTTANDEGIEGQVMEGQTMEGQAMEDQAAAPPPPSSEVLQAEINDLKDKLLRAIAETENMRRRGDREREDANKYAVTGFAGNLTEVADNLRRALDSVPAEAKEDNEVLSTLLEGIEMTERGLLSAFERAGIRKVEPQIGEKADPNRHEVLFEVPGTEQPGGTIIQVVQTGYQIHNRLLRAAKVGVAKSPPRVDTSA